MNYEMQEYGQDISMDYNDTIASLTYEEWVVKELNIFKPSAIANLKVGLVDNQNYKNRFFLLQMMSGTTPRPHHRVPYILQTLGNV